MLKMSHLYQVRSQGEVLGFPWIPPPLRLYAISFKQTPTTGGEKKRHDNLAGTVILAQCERHLPPLLKILATPLPFMLYYAYIKRDNISTSHLVYRSLNASLQCNSPLLSLDYYEMSFLVHVMRITRSGAAEEGWISKITIWKHNLEALFHVETTRW